MPKQNASVLAQANIGQIYAVLRVIAPRHSPEWADQLGDIGFIAGEQVMVMARGMPGGDPLSVRVGASTFALRLAEAQCVCIEPVVNASLSKGSAA